MRLQIMLSFGLSFGLHVVAIRKNKMNQFHSVAS
jgi:hypothetical protein